MPHFQICYRAKIDGEGEGGGKELLRRKKVINIIKKEKGRSMLLSERDKIKRKGEKRAPDQIFMYILLRYLSIYEYKEMNNLHVFVLHNAYTTRHPVR